MVKTHINQPYLTNIRLKRNLILLTILNASKKQI